VPVFSGFNAMKRLPFSILLLKKIVQVGKNDRAVQSHRNDKKPEKLAKCGAET